MEGRAWRVYDVGVRYGRLWGVIECVHIPICVSGSCNACKYWADDVICGPVVVTRRWVSSPRRHVVTLSRTLRQRTLLRRITINSLIVNSTALKTVCG